MLLTLGTVEVGILLVDCGLWIDDGFSRRLYSMKHSQMVQVLNPVLHTLVALRTVIVGVPHVDFRAGIGPPLGDRDQRHVVCQYTMLSIFCPIAIVCFANPAVPVGIEWVGRCVWIIGDSSLDDYLMLVAQMGAIIGL